MLVPLMAARALAWTSLLAFIALVASTPMSGYQYSLYETVGWRFLLLVAAGLAFILGSRRTLTCDQHPVSP